jgi:LAO/AO transport system kinase
VVTAEEVLARLRGPDPRALPRLATLIENEDPRGLAALDLLFPHTGGAHVVGVTGPPGAGKSTLVAALLAAIRQSGRRVAVVAVDPSSPVSGGAVLGDRVRMMDRYADDGVFVRSMASRGRKGGLAWATAELVHLLDAAGFPLILVETVGTGQDGTDIAALADTVVVVEAPGLGDGVQAIKSGLLEIGDIVVVNKADQPGAKDALRTLRAALQMDLGAAQRRPEICATTATTGDGIATLLAAINAHVLWLDESGERTARREARAEAEILTGLRSHLERSLAQHSAASPPLADAIARVARREMTPRRAVETLAEALAGPVGA